MQIDTCTGQIKVKTAILNIDLNVVYTIPVRAYIAGNTGVYTEQNITITVLPVPTPPNVPAQTMAIKEHSPALTYCGQLNFTNQLPINVTWTLALDGSNGLFIVKPNGQVFVANISNAVTALTYANANSWQLLVTATTVGNAQMVGSGYLTMKLIEIDDPPYLYPPSQLILTLEQNATVGASVFTPFITTADPNAATSPFFSNTTFMQIAPSVAATRPECSIVNMTGVGWPTVDGTTTGTLLFSVTRSPSSGFAGQITFAALPTALPSGPFYSFATPYAYGNNMVRAAYQLCLNLSDAYGAWSVAAVQVGVVANIPAQPVISGISGATTMATLGSEIVYFSGANFQPSDTWPVTAWYTNGVRTYNATGCQTVPNENLTLIECNTVPGTGVNYNWHVWQKGAPISSIIPLITSYAGPMVISLMGASNVPTDSKSTLTMVTFTGYNFGPSIGWNTTVSVTYGLTNQYSCALSPNAADAQTVVRCYLATGSGANLPWVLTVDGQSFSSVTLGTTISYLPPSITNITAVGANLTGIDTAGGTTIFITGVLSSG